MWLEGESFELRLIFYVALFFSFLFLALLLPDKLKACRSVDDVKGTEDECSELAAQVIVTMGLACETKTAKFVSTAVDSLHKLVSCGFVHGRMPRGVPLPLAVLGQDAGAGAGARVKAADLVVAIIASCFVVPDPQVHLQILKACLAVATMPACELHGAALLNAVRTCFSILLMEEVPVNETTAKGTLRQIIHHVFKCYEVECAGRAVAAPVSPPADQKKGDAPTLEDVAKELVSDLVDSVVDAAVAKAAAAKESSPPGEKPSEETAADVAYNDCYQLFRALCKMAVAEPAPKSKELDIRRTIHRKEFSLELMYAVVEMAGPTLRSDPRFVEVIVRKHLCGALVHNGFSTQPRVLKFTLSIFLSLMRKFKVQLRSEIGVFLSNIFLRVLETPNSTVQQKYLVLQLLSHICRDPQALSDLYINYDCDLDSTDVFVRMVNDISKTAQGSGVFSISSDGSGAGAGGTSAGSSSAGASTPQQEMSVQTLGLECLVMVLNSLSDWTKEGTATTTPAPAPASPSGSASRTGGLSSSLSSPDEAQGRCVTPAAAAQQSAAGEDDITDEELAELRKNKQRKQTLEDIKSRWSLDPKRAIEYMRKLEIIDDTPESLARFLYTTDGLDKKVLGEFIGGSKPFNKAVLHEYVSCFSFAGMQLDEALRYFLGMFLLPGEGQVVDRIMENFGAQYYKSNSKDTFFVDADAVYKLSFAIIMLATDLHNPKITNKLTFADFNKMVNKDLAMNCDEQYLRGVFDRIAAKRLELLDSSGTGGQCVISAFLNARQRQQLYLEETNKWVATSMKQMRAQRGQTKEFFHASRIEYVQPIFESIWASAVVALSVLLESNDDPHVIALCISGFQHAIHVSCVFYMETERTTFVSALEKLTLLSNLREMRPKNISAIKALINLASTEGNYLQSSWVAVLRCVSLLERLHLLGSGLQPDLPGAARGNVEYQQQQQQQQLQQQQQQQQLRGTKRKPSADHSASSLRTSGSVGTSYIVPQSSFRTDVAAVEAVNSRAVSMDIDPLWIDRVFSGSVSLSDTAIIDFVRALCQVSLSEVHSPTPRIFSLQKIVEVASYNMNNRMRLVWHDMWLILQQHFIACGCHELSAVSLFSVDSLRQLAMKYLEKDELADFNFQKEFLKPFEVVVATTQSESVKEFIVQSLRQLVVARTSNICSGWKSIFTVLTTCAEDCNVAGSGGRIIPLAFELLADIVKSHYSIVSHKFFRELIATLASFGKNTLYPDISLRSIAMLFSCVSNIDPHAPLSSSFTDDDDDDDDKGGDDAAAAADGSSSDDAQKQQRKVMSVWFPILTGLSSIVAHPNLDVRSSALDTLFEILAEYGAQFTPHVWEILFRGVLLPLFDSVGYSHGVLESGDADQSWLATTCMPALERLVALFDQYYSAVAAVVPDVLHMLQAFVTQSWSRQLSAHGTTAFFALLNRRHAAFSPDVWGVVSDFLTACLDADLAFVRRLLASVIAPAPRPADQQDDSTESCAACKKVLSAGSVVCPLCGRAHYCSAACQARDSSSHIACCVRVFLGSDAGVRAAANAGTPLLCVVAACGADAIAVDSSRVQQKPAAPTKERVDVEHDRSVRVFGGIDAFLAQHGVAAVREETIFRFVDELAVCVAASSLCSSTSTVARAAAASRSRSAAAVFARGAAYALMAQKLYLRVTQQLLLSGSAGFAEPRHFALAEALYALTDVAAPAASETVLDALDQMLALDDGHYRAHITALYAYIARFVVHADPRVRALVQKHVQRVGQLFVLSSSSKQ